MLKIQCYMPSLNEYDILQWSLNHLYAQGVHVHVLDGGSTDHTLPLLADLRTSDRLNGRGEWLTWEQFPAPGSDDGIWSCSRMLSRIEELAAAGDADWILLNDADEFRTPNGLLTIAEELLIVTGTEITGKLATGGYNAVDFYVEDYMCTDCGWTPDQDPQLYFQYYSTKTPIALLPQVKLWRNIPGVRVDLQSTGGHDARFPGRKIWNKTKWRMRHYPYRTPEQARRKLETRIARRDHVEHARGWGVHYDVAFPPGFIWDPAKLERR